MKMWSDEKYLRCAFKAYLGYKLNLKNPKSFNEKLQWLKLHDRNPEYTTMVDKVKVKKYVAEKIGSEYVIPTLGVWESVHEIDFSILPNQFVLKCNHNSGLGIYICKEKDSLKINEVKKELQKGLRQDYYRCSREWPYKQVERRILAEEYLSDDGNELMDYKFMCFGGEVKCCFVCSDRHSEKGLHVTFFDREWNVMPFERHYPSVKEGMKKPKNYEKMVELAEILSQNIPFVRVDFYDINGKIYFGELTLYPGGGLEEFTPEEWDYKLGSWIEL